MNIPAMKSVVTINVMCLLLAFGCVSQNEVASIDNRISELEMRNSEAAKKSAALKSEIQNREGQEQALRLQTAGLRQQIAEINEDIRKLTGRIEELEHSINSQQRKEADAAGNKQVRMDQLAASNKSNDARIYRIEQYLNFETSKPTAAPVKSTAKIVPVPRLKKSLPKMKFTDRQSRLLIKATPITLARNSVNSSSDTPNQSVPTMPNSGSAKYIIEKNGMRKLSLNIRK